MNNQITWVEAIDQNGMTFFLRRNGRKITAYRETGTAFKAVAHKWMNDASWSKYLDKIKDKIVDVWQAAMSAINRVRQAVMQLANDVADLFESFAASLVEAWVEVKSQAKPI